MSYLALYRKYRPNNFDDLVGQTEISSIIKNEILTGRISHAYLFSGPRGTGKTSTAKIIAKMINCSNLSVEGIPCDKCPSCLNFSSNTDIVEIDAASNNGVDEIRDLRDKVNLVPTFGKYKIYIIDEVHMLTNQAFNALLKTLEEPPLHVIFILATTEFYKIPVTVTSRCQKFQFLKFSNSDIVNRLINIANKENIKIDNDALYEIARLSDGGLRDAINMLDQLSSYKDEEINVDDVYKLSGVISYFDFSKLLTSIYSNNVVEIVDFMENVDKKGKNLDRFNDDLIAFLKDLLVYKNTNNLEGYIVEKSNALTKLAKLFSSNDLYKMIIDLNELSVKVKNSNFAKVLFIAEFIKLSNYFNNCDSEEEIVKKTVKVAKNSEKNTKNDIINDDLISKSEQKIEKKEYFNLLSDKNRKIRINNTFSSAAKNLKENFVQKWFLVQEKLSNDTNYSMIAGMLNDVEILVVGEFNVLFLAKYDSLLERLFQNLEKIEQLLFEIFGVKYKVMFLLNDEWKYEKEKYIENVKNGIKYTYISEEEDNSTEEKDEDIETIISILGNDVVSFQ